MLFDHDIYGGLNFPGISFSPEPNDLVALPEYAEKSHQTYEDWSLGVEESSGMALGATGEGDPTYVSEVVVTAASDSGLVYYYSFSKVTFATPHSDVFMRDEGHLDQARVEADDTPDTPLEFELAIDQAATAAAILIQNAMNANPNIEYGCYIYLDSDGTVQVTPITSGTVSNVQIDFNGIQPSQVLGIVHSHPQGNIPSYNTINQFPSPAVPRSDGVIEGDWAQYDYLVRENQTHGNLVRTYIINNGEMREYRGLDRDNVSLGEKVPMRFYDYVR